MDPLTESRSLRSSEWVLVGSLLLIFASLLFIAKITAIRSSSFLETRTLPSHPLCPIRIEGAVKKPGTYSVLPGTPLKKVLAKSQPHRFADLRSLDMTARVEGPLEIHLNELTAISIQIEGAVPVPFTISLPVGTKVSDLRTKIALNAEADLSIFKSRRLLKDGEILKVPEKGD